MCVCVCVCVCARACAFVNMYRNNYISSICLLKLSVYLSL